MMRTVVRHGRSVQWFDLRLLCEVRTPATSFMQGPTFLKSVFICASDHTALQGRSKDSE